MHHLAMKIKGLALLGLIPALLLSSMATSFADATPTPSPSSSASPDFQTLMDQYKIASEQYRILQQERDDLRTQINRTFMIAVDVANKEARTAMKLARTATAKNDVIVKQKNAINAASLVRDTAIAALGALPTPPVKPVKVVEMAPLSKMKSQKPSPTSTRKSKN
jgi:hypothetical protein